MRSKLLIAAWVAATLPVLGGCATNSQMENTVYDIQRRVAALDKELKSSTGQMSAAEQARLDANDQQLKELNQATQDNQRELSKVASKLDQLSNKLYRERGYSAQTTPKLPVDGEPMPIPPRTPVPQEPGMEPMPQTPMTPPQQQTPVPSGPGAPPESPQPVPPVASNRAPEAAPAGGSAEAEYTKAQKDYVRQDYPKALDEFSKYIEQYPNSENAANAQFWKAKALLSEEKYGDAITEFEKVRANYPTHQKAPLAMHQEAVCYARLGQNQKAIDLLNQVIRDYPSTPAADQARQDLKRLQQQR